MKSFIVGFFILFSSFAFGFEGQPFKGKIVTENGTVHSYEISEIYAYELFITKCNVDYSTGLAESRFVSDGTLGMNFYYDGIELNFKELLVDFHGYACDFRYGGKQTYIYERDNFEIKISFWAEPLIEGDKIQRVKIWINGNPATGTVIENL